MTLSQQQVCKESTVSVSPENAEEAETLFSQEAGVEYPRGEKGNALLLQAAEDGRMELVKMLVNRGAKINPKDNFHGCTPLTQAALMGRLDVVKFLIERGANVNANCTNHGHSYYLIAEGIGPRNPTPLGSAAEESQIAVIEYLLQKKAKINGRDGSSYTPLMWACETGSPETIKTLLRHGADVTLKTDLGETARSLAAKRKDASVVLALLNGGSKQ